LILFSAIRRLLLQGDRRHFDGRGHFARQDLQQGRRQLPSHDNYLISLILIMQKGGRFCRAREAPANSAGRRGLIAGLQERRSRA
jgi:hypothetical protein